MSKLPDAPPMGGQAQVDRDRIAFQENPPSFSIHADAQSSFTLDTWIDIDTTWWAGVDYDFYQMYDSSTGGFTVKHAGVWLLIGSWAWSNNANNGEIGVRFLENGTALAADIRYSMANITNIQQVTGIFRFGVGDVLKMGAKQNRGSGQTNSNLYTYQYFTGTRLSL